MYLGQALVRYEPFWDALQVLASFYDADVLDIGCGYGVSSLEILKQGCRRLIGIDTDYRILEMARVGLERTLVRLPELDVDLRRARFEEGDAEDLRFRAETFDRVVLSLSLHHTADMRRTISEAARACKSDGRIIIIEPEAAQPGTLYEAEVQFGIIDGDEERQKRAARRVVESHPDLQVLHEFESVTTYQCDNFERFCRATKPRKSLEELRAFLEQSRRGPLFELMAPRRIHVCKPNY